MQIVISRGRSTSSCLLTEGQHVFLTEGQHVPCAHACVGACTCACVLQVDWDYFGFQFEPAFSRWPVMMAAGEMWGWFLLCVQLQKPFQSVPANLNL
jgi:hypothetical protein